MCLVRSSALPFVAVGLFENGRVIVCMRWQTESKVEKEMTTRERRKRTKARE
jgi:hypothetical protein